MTDGHVELLTEWPPPETAPSQAESDDQRDHGEERRIRHGRRRSESPSERKRPRPSRDDDVGGDDESEARVALASWCRRNPAVLASATSSSSSANGRLNAVRRTREGRRFLEARLRALEEKEGGGTSTRRLHVMATFAFELGRFEDAERYSQKWYEGSTCRDLDALRHLEYLDRLPSVCEGDREALWFRRRVKLAASAARKARAEVKDGKGVEKVVEVERRSAQDLSEEAFKEEFVGRRRPVVITGLAAEVLGGEDKQLWDVEFVRKHMGSKKAVLKRRDPSSVEWARLESAAAGGACSEEPLEPFLSNLASGVDDGRYLFDWSLPLHCPEVSVAAPRYFRHDFLKTTSDGALYRRSWPSLFVGGANVRSDLHVDAFASHFWMFLMHGKKRWTFFDRSSLESLGPTYDGGLDPVFQADPVERPESVKGLTPRVVTLEAGELLFVPSGSPHAVENLSARGTVAVSGNFVDGSNAGEAGQHLRHAALVDPGAADLLRQLVTKGLVEDVPAE